MAKTRRLESVFPTISLFLAIFLFLGAKSYASSNIDPAAASVLAAFKAASGNGAWDSVSTIVTRCEINQGGLQGVDINTLDVINGKFSDNYTIGGLLAGDGYDGTRSWSVDLGGIPKYLGGDFEVRNAVTNSYLTALAYWYPSRRTGDLLPPQTVQENGSSYEVVTAQPAGGLPIDLWFDSQSKLLVRTVEQTPRRTITTTYSNFQTVSGVVMPYTTVISTGNPKYDMTVTVDSISINTPVNPSVFNIPPTPAPDYTITGNASSVTVPFQYTINHIYVPVLINGKGPFDAVLDSGARLAVTPGFAKKFKIDYAGEFPASGIGPNTVTEAIAKVSTLQIGDLTINNITGSVLPMPTPMLTPLIGAEVFKRFAVKIDFDQDLITLTPLTSFVYNGTGISVPFEFVGDIPAVDGILDGVTGEFMVDTGLGNSLDLFPSFVTANKLTSKYSTAFNTVSGYGVGGAQTASVARAFSFSVGGATVQDLLIYLSNAQHGSYTDTSLAGNIGNGFLHRFNLIFDYRDQKIIFEANSHKKDDDQYERLGVTFDGSPNGMVVTAVVSGSPADLAGIKPGDTIFWVDGRTIHQQDADWLENQILQPAGTNLELKVLQGTSTLDVTVTLKDLI